MKLKTFLSLRKVAFDAAQDGMGQHFQNREQAREDAERQDMATFAAEGLPGSGRNIPPASTVREILMANHDRPAAWADSRHGGRFARRDGIFSRLQTKDGAATRYIGALGPERGLSAYMCLQGQDCLSPGWPLFHANGRRHITTSELNTALANGARLPIDTKNWNGFVLSDDAARGINFRLPGMWHTLHKQQYADGSGHFAVNDGSDIISFDDGGVVRRTPGAYYYERAADLGGGDGSTTAVTAYNNPIPEADGKGSLTGYTNRMFTAIPASIDPESAARQFYTLMRERAGAQRQLRDELTLTEDQYVQRFRDANGQRAEGSAFVLPSIFRPNINGTAISGDAADRLGVKVRRSAPSSDPAAVTVPAGLEVLGNM